MNVSELSDVEIERAMVWLYAKNRFINRDYQVGDVVGNLIWTREVSYLTDYNLTMPLAVEHNLQPSFSNSGMTSVPYYHSDFTGTGGHNIKHGTTYSNKNPLRAIAEVLIMIAMEKKG